MSGKSRSRPVKKETVVTTAGRHPRENFGIVNLPVYHASIVLYPSMAAHDKAA